MSERVQANVHRACAFPRSYLVVDDDVHGAVRGVGRQIGQVEGLVDDALTGKCGVSVKKD